MASTSPHQDAFGINVAADLPNHLRTLARLGELCLSESPLDTLVRQMIPVTMKALEAQQCLVVLMDQPHLQVYLTAATPGEIQHQSLLVDSHTWQHLQTVEQMRTYVRQMVHSLPSSPSAEHTTISQSLGTLEKVFGLIDCHLSHSPLPEDEALLAIIGNHLIFVLRQNQSKRVLEQHYTSVLKSFFQALTNAVETPGEIERYADELGYDLVSPHTVVMMELAGDEQLLVPLRDEIAARFNSQWAGTFVLWEGKRLSCLINMRNGMGEAELKTWMRDLVKRTSSSSFRLFAGIGPCLVSTADYRQGFGEAQDALEMGRQLHPEGGVTTMSDLSILRYLNPRYVSAAREHTAPDHYVELVRRISEHDRLKGTDYLATLEAYLESGLDMDQTGTVLGLHRNTIQMRLGKIKEFFSFDIKKPQNWLDLQLAIMVVRMSSPQQS